LNLPVVFTNIAAGRACNPYLFLILNVLLSIDDSFVETNLHAS